MITAKEFIDKLLDNKKLILFLFIGVLLVLGSGFFSKSDEEFETQKAKNSEVYINESKLEKILSNIEGAGTVEVYINYENNGEKVLAYDTRKEERNTVNSGRNNEPYVLTNKYPEIKGILVVATGAKNENVKNRLLKCVKAITDVPYGNICIEVRKV